MTPRRRRRAIAVAALLLCVGGAAALLFQAFRENMMYFRTPSDVAAGAVTPGALIRLGGLVKPGSVQRAGEGLQVRFVLADCEHELEVEYDGILPDLFREGQGIVASGRLHPDGHFVASEVLAKHDENYMPPELAERLGPAPMHSCEPFKPVAS